MRRVVREQFLAFSIPKEGWVRYLYADVKGWVTTAVGVLVDDCRTLTPPRSALGLPMVVGNRPARPDEIAADWRAVAVEVCEATLGSQRRTGRPPSGKPLECQWRGLSRVCMAHRGHLAAMQATRCRLTDDGVRLVTDGKLVEMWRSLLLRFPRLDQAPADAQLATLSMAWALGPAWDEDEWPKLTAAIRTGDWATAAGQCKLRESDNPGVIPRNRRNRELYLAADDVVERELNRDVLWGTGGEPVRSVDDTPTEPELPAAEPSEEMTVQEIAEYARATMAARRVMTSDAVADFVRDDDEGD